MRRQRTTGRRHNTRKRTTRLSGRGKQTGGGPPSPVTTHHHLALTAAEARARHRRDRRPRHRRNRHLQLAQRPMRTRPWRGVWMSWRRKIISNPPRARGQLPDSRGNDIPSSLRPTTHRSTNPLCAVYFYFIFFTHILRETETSSSLVNSYYK